MKTCFTSGDTLCSDVGDMSGWQESLCFDIDRRVRVWEFSKVTLPPRLWGVHGVLGCPAIPLAGCRQHVCASPRAWSRGVAKKLTLWFETFPSEFERINLSLYKFLTSSSITIRHLWVFLILSIHGWTFWERGTYNEYTLQWSQTFNVMYQLWYW